MLVSNSYLHRVISGQQRGPAPAILRTILSGAEFFYASVTRLRNRLYESGLRPTHKLTIPVISVGNITAGGTGKTPIVRYLATQLHQAGHHPAILIRGYHRGRGGMSDEESLLAEQLREQRVTVHANPDRVSGGQEVLQKHPEVNVFLLDDGFQHRRLARDIDIVLIDATNPIGHGHIHPRGLLREPLCGLARASIIILTRCEQQTPAELQEIETTLRRYVPNIAIFRSRFIHNGLRSAATLTSGPPDNSLEVIRAKKTFATAAIANPGPFESSLRTMSKTFVGQHWFADHHDYTTEDLIAVRREAINVGADVIVTTEKDWVKMRQLRSALDGTPPIWRLDLDISLEPEDEKALSDLIAAGLRGNRPMHNGSAQGNQPGESQQDHHHQDPAR